ISDSQRRGCAAAGLRDVVPARAGRRAAHCQRDHDPQPLARALQGAGSLIRPACALPREQTKVEISTMSGVQSKTAIADRHDIAAMRREYATPSLYNESIALEVDGLNLYYGTSQALKSIGLNIPQKKVTAFIGPSGCGKSTLLRCFNRMNDLIDGCRIDGQ